MINDQNLQICNRSHFVWLDIFSTVSIFLHWLCFAAIELDCHLLDFKAFIGHRLLPRPNVLSHNISELISEGNHRVRASNLEFFSFLFFQSKKTTIHCCSSTALFFGAFFISLLFCSSQNSSLVHILIILLLKCCNVTVTFTMIFLFSPWINLSTKNFLSLHRHVCSVRVRGKCRFRHAFIDNFEWDSRDRA